MLKKIIGLRCQGKKKQSPPLANRKDTDDEAEQLRVKSSPSIESMSNERKLRTKECTELPKWPLLTKSSTDGSSVPRVNPVHVATIRGKRLMKELKDLHSRQEGAFCVDLVNDNLAEWNILLHGIDPDSMISREMKAHNIAHIQLNLIFSENFPFSPPFMRVVSPRIRNGFVLEDGAICMELLTASGWSSAYTVEAIIMQFSASVVKGGGRLEHKKTCKPYNRKAAEQTFRSLSKIHEKYGWVTPPHSDG